jgi:hypothetical protein
VVSSLYSLIELSREAAVSDLSRKELTENLSVCFFDSKKCLFYEIDSHLQGLVAGSRC